MHSVLQWSFFSALLHTEAGAASCQEHWNRCQVSAWAVHCLPEILGHQEALLGGTAACNHSHTDRLTCYSSYNYSTYKNWLKSHVSFFGTGFRAAWVLHRAAHQPFVSKGDENQLHKSWWNRVCFHGLYLTCSYSPPCPQGPTTAWVAQVEGGQGTRLKAWLWYHDHWYQVVELLTPALQLSETYSFSQVLHYPDGFAVSDAERDAPAPQTADSVDSKRWPAATSSGHSCSRPPTKAQVTTFSGTVEYPKYHTGN